MIERLRRAVHGRRRAQGRGAVAVEAALVTPFVFLLLIGILEFSFVMRDYVAVTSASRSGARMASTGAILGPQVCDAGETGTECSNSGAPELAKVAANAIQTQSSALNKDSINYILIYKADAKGFPGSLTGWGSNPRADCLAAGSCVAYTWVKASDKFKYSAADGTWTSSTINACVSTGDSVGVYLNTTHSYITKFFGSSTTISDRTVMRFEPQPALACAAGQHT
jgi:hypothetical protein